MERRFGAAPASCRGQGRSGHRLGLCLGYVWPNEVIDARAEKGDCTAASSTLSARPVIPGEAFSTSRGISPERPLDSFRSLGVTRGVYRFRGPLGVGAMRPDDVSIYGVQDSGLTIGRNRVTLAAAKRHQSETQAWFSGDRCCPLHRGSGSSGPVCRGLD
jgi:hypothetical protein